MARSCGFPIGLWLLAALLIAPGTRDGFAEDVTPHHAPDGADSPQLPPAMPAPASTDDSAEHAGQFEDHPLSRSGDNSDKSNGRAPIDSAKGAVRGDADQRPENGGGKEPRIGTAVKETDTPDVHAKDPIDTRITVQPHRPAGKFGKTRQAKIIVRPNALVKWRTRTRSVPGITGNVTRNAVGVQVQPHERIIARDAPVRPRSNADGPSGTGSDIAGRGAGTVGGNNPTFDHAPLPHPSPGALAAPTVANRGVVGGSGGFRRGSGPSVIGGSTKQSAGLNGSTIQPRH